MIEVRPFNNLGRFQNDWLNARYHFSFSEYYDPSRMSWGPLRVWNNDRIKAGTGFQPHPHRDMEIITYVMSGAISHEDHLGNKGRTGAGEIQIMSAGTGIVHAEFNKEPGETELFQIWIEPSVRGAKPRWETLAFPTDEKAGKLVTLASGKPADNAPLKIYQDAALLCGTLRKGESVDYALGADRRAYMVAAKGSVSVNGTNLGPRDGAAIAKEAKLTIKAAEDAEVVLVDVP